MIIKLQYKCGHKETAGFEYPKAAKDWQKWAKTEQCRKCSNRTGGA